MLVIRKEFRKHQRLVKEAVDEAKESWICRVTKEVEKAKKDGKHRWASIRLATAKELLLGEDHHVQLKYVSQVVNSLVGLTRKEQHGLITSLGS